MKRPDEAIEAMRRAENMMAEMTEKLGVSPPAEFKPPSGQVLEYLDYLESELMSTKLDIEQYGLALGDPHEYCIREVTGNQVTEDDEVLRADGHWRPHSSANDYRANELLIVRKHKPEPTPEQKFRDAYLNGISTGDYVGKPAVESMVDAAKKAGLLPSGAARGSDPYDSKGRGLL